MSFVNAFGSSKRKNKQNEHVVKKMLNNARTKQEISLSMLPKNMVHLGDGLFVMVNTFHKETRVPIRVYVTDDNGFLRPTKEGVSLKPEVWSSVLSTLRTFPALYYNGLLKKKLFTRADHGSSKPVAGELPYSCLLKQALPKAKGNRTLLSTNILGNVGRALDLKHKNWHFYKDQKRKIPFRDDIPVCLLCPVETVPDPEFPVPIYPVRDGNDSDACQEPYALHNDLSVSQINDVVQRKNCLLREEEGKGLTKPQLSRLNQLLIEYQDTFNLGEEPTLYIEHRIRHRKLTSGCQQHRYRISPA
ncbi:hypothetical protein HNY73_003064 [Argiope bruennichi]|uniref:Transcriptional coactivator p15 (PC4) C-terminal domain-containing protein n=1 Tax=Argiope bruennichi TaxID=94029 RepID=A0A8T0FY55_ARGBR|nr:hypothetical protein HNY73_003064 [Argiope bruennichi]